MYIAARSIAAVFGCPECSQKASRLHQRDPSSFPRDYILSAFSPSPPSQAIARACRKISFFPAGPEKENKKGPREVPIFQMIYAYLIFEQNKERSFHSLAANEMHSTTVP